MTKFKEYLRAKGIKLECDYVYLPYGYIECVETRVLDNYIIVAMFSNCAGWEYAVFNKHGVCGCFDEDDRQTYISGPHCDPEFTSWMCNTDCEISSTLFTVAVGMYENDAKVRVAFKHMRAGIMDKKAFYKFLVRQYPKHIRSV